MKVRTSSQVDAEVVYCCSCCHAHLADHKAIISKAFQGRHGRAYLFDNVINVSPGPPENRLLLTGLHVCQWRAPLNHCTAALCRGPPRPLELLLSCVRVCRWQLVADIYCNACDTRLGWKYIDAFEESQKYKEGKYILEKAMILKDTEIRQQKAEALMRLQSQQEQQQRQQRRRRQPSGSGPVPNEDEDEDEDEDAANGGDGEDDEEEEDDEGRDDNQPPGPGNEGGRP